MMKNEQGILRLGASRLRRAVLAHTLAVVASWVSLRYGWGLDVERPWVLAGFWFWAGVVWPVVIPYALRERE
jgi:hypothetical protein